eukprot:gnl/TRDRNA2_/TRDRNA2_189769_c0_seq1.p1 gnl/TRDRNA2_/TRDRNA2_189769_c0~~gnl/TRDRNA2_/TRDRNA2_189769_c0_seq1.p1  ORF type:complete len:416 (-),score=76.21 gnl/TRDRNA2_/TRDRNA2_189769_c0_seq1:59-1306(-)
MGAAWGATLDCVACRKSGKIPEALQKEAVAGFEKVFTQKPTALGVAPGRVEVLGNHTDYNEGFILSGAIDRYVAIVGRRTEGTEGRIASSQYNESTVNFSTADPQKLSGDQAWANYVLGVVKEVQALVKDPIGGFDAYIVSSVPPGAGVSSSAALEMATAMLLAQLFRSSVGKLDDLTLIKASKAAENNFVGMGCGILDQYTSGRGHAGSLLHLDCRTLSCGYVPLRGARFVLANTHAPHQLVDGAYDKLRTHCFAAAEAIKTAAGDDKITHLRDVDTALFEKHSGALSEEQLKCSRHIVGENSRVHQGIAALKAGDLATLGKAMSESHKSSREDFGNSCPQLDTMVDCADGLDGFLGGRLMGGGFGGCTINLVKEDKVSSFVDALGKAYKEKTGIDATMLVCSTGDGSYGEALA